jgi:uncharacterized damage-inducible protein DinB
MMTDAPGWRDAFIGESKFRLADYLQQIRVCVGMLSEEQFWWRPNEISNAVGNLVLHLVGNVGMWIIEGIGGERFERDRPAEFAARGPQPKAEVLATLERVVDRASATLDSVDAGQLLREHDIQGYKMSGLAAIYHVVEHFALHSGQIIYATKIATGQPIAKYDQQGHRLSGHRGHP